jgi:hypothetical protein
VSPAKPGPIPEGKGTSPSKFFLLHEKSEELREFLLHRASSLSATPMRPPTWEGPSAVPLPPAALPPSRAPLTSQGLCFLVCKMGACHHEAAVGMCLHVRDVSMSCGCLRNHYKPGDLKEQEWTLWPGYE